jgi:hypothetical protein
MVVSMRKTVLIVLMFTASLFFQACGFDTTFVFELNPGVDTVEIHTLHIDTEATARAGRRILDVKVVSNSVDTSKIGVYEIVYETTYLEETYTLSRFVTVVDETPPVITLNPGIDTIFINETWVDASVTVFDNSLGEVFLEVLGEVDITKVGVYEVHYIARDESGNTASIVRFVNVIHREIIEN